MHERHNGQVQGVPPSLGHYPIVGREAELQALRSFLDDPSPRACLVFSGEPGIGKTALWQAGLNMAAGCGFKVLSTRAYEEEAGLSFAAMADLLEDIDGSYLGAIPAPQMHALEVALHRVEPDSRPPEPFAIASGFQHIVRAVATNVTTVLAIDDVQWLDRSSADTLLFLARRLTEPNVRFIVSRRGDEPSALERALARVGVTDVHVGGLSLGAISRLVLDRYKLAMPRRVLRQVHEASHGNPLVALEFGRLLNDLGPPDVGVDLPVPNLVDGALDARVRALRAPVRQALLVMALSPRLSRGHLDLIAQQAAIDEALDDGLLVSERDGLRLAHPLLAAAVKKVSTSSQVRQIHQALAVAVDDAVESSRHLAVATISSNAEIAATVEAAARLAVDRGALQEAEELSAHALRLTPAGDALEPDRVLELARRHLEVGNWSSAVALLEGHMADLPHGRQRALGHLLLAEASVGGSPEDRYDLAIVEAGEDNEIRVAAMARKSLALSANRVERLAEAGQLAADAWAQRSGSNQEALVLSARAWSLVMLGKPIDELDVAVLPEPSGTSLEETAVERPYGVRHAFRGEMRTAEAALRELADRAETRTDVRGQSACWVQLCEFALRRGDIAQARGYLHELDQWSGVPELRSLLARIRAVLAATAGYPREADGWAERVQADAQSGVADGWDRLETMRAVGLAALFQSDFARSVDNLMAVWAHSRREGLDLGAFPVAGDLVEALVASTRVDEASDITDEVAALAASQDHPWGRATAKRCAATVELGTGHVEGAAAGLSDAATDFATLGLDFEWARCLFGVGRLQGRAKKRTEARRALTESEKVFDRLGCSGWADKARIEVARISGRKANDDSALTPAEQRVVDLAASGLSNKEIATSLFVSVYTVEAHLSHSYAKLGVRSRSQLAARMTSG